MSKNKKKTNNIPVPKMVNCKLLNIRSAASTDSEVLGRLGFATIILVSEEENGWSKLADQPGYVMSEFLK